MTMLSMTTDYLEDAGDPSPYLRRIADAGFTHLHWCHHWGSDFLYSRAEVDQIERWLDEYGLQVLNVHGSDGHEKSWYAGEAYRREAGVELVRNRLELAARLGSDVVIMHAVQPQPNDPQRFWDALYSSLDALEPVARALGVRIAVENLNDPGHWGIVTHVLEDYPPDFVGLCYDSGHGNKGEDGLAHLERLKDRLIAVHLHDNDGTADQHLIPFTGTVDWDRLIQIVGSSHCTGPVNLEAMMQHTGIRDESVFLERSFDAACRIEGMLPAAAASQD